MNARVARFSDAPWARKDGEFYYQVLIGGAGGIGSWLTILLSRTNTAEPIEVIDFDRIETHNLGGQLFSNSSVGSTKVGELARINSIIGSASINPTEGRVEVDFICYHPIVFSAFDNMIARKNLFNSWLTTIKKGGEELPEEFQSEHEDESVTYEEFEPSECLFMDGRLNAEQMQIFCIRGNDTAAIDKYQKEFLFNDNEVEDLPCTFKQTSHSAAMIASHMVGFYTNFISNIKEGDDDRALPFMWEYHIPLNLVTEINI